MGALGQRPKSGVLDGLGLEPGCVGISTHITDTSGDLQGSPKPALERASKRPRRRNAAGLAEVELTASLRDLLAPQVRRLNTNPGDALRLRSLNLKMRI
eukprot:9132163-Alexandrium_andersonii.AAC.1